jgi:hypothetical protein
VRLFSLSLLHSRAPRGAVTSCTDASAPSSTLAVGESLVIPTRATSGTVISNNIAQCATVLSNDTRFAIPEGTTAIVPGEYGLAAVDGANAVRLPSSSFLILFFPPHHAI